MNPTKANEFFGGVRKSTVERYTEYWNKIRPVTADDFFRRYLFAFTSVHTTWEGNIRGYNNIKNLGWLNDKDDLRDRLIRAKCGMFNNRTRYIWDFKQKFYANPDLYCKVQGDWQTYRNFLVDDINGLGIAKVSFTLEMCFPVEAKVTCIDTHGIQLYEITHKNFKSKDGVEIYENAEKHWVDSSAELLASPTITRAIYWDKKQKRRNSRYWTVVLETSH